jgi:hypothetical protein
VTEERRHLDLPDRRKYTYAQLEEKIDEHADYLEQRLSRFFKRCLIVFAIIGISCTLAIAGYGIVLRAVQTQRRDACLAQNQRHDATLAALNKIINDAIRDNPKQAKEIRQSIDANVRLINALAPKVNCDRVAPERGFLP